jgi:hypothetical protein
MKFSIIFYASPFLLLTLAIAKPFTDLTEAIASPLSDFTFAGPVDGAASTEAPTAYHTSFGIVQFKVCAPVPTVPLLSEIQICELVSPTGPPDLEVVPEPSELAPPALPRIPPTSQQFEATTVTETEPLVLVAVPVPEASRGNDCFTPE